MIKALFVIGIFKFLSWRFGYVEKRLDKKAKVNVKLITSHAAQQVTTIHILRSISRSKDKEAMKFGQLIEFNLRNMFLEKSHKKYSG